MRVLLFPKIFRDLRPEALMSRCAECGIDAPVMIVRDGFAVTAATVAETAPRFRRAAEAAGMTVDFAVCDLGAEAFAAAPGFAGILAENGIRRVRLGLTPPPPELPVRQYRETFRRHFAAAAATAATAGLRAVVQVHHFGFYPHNASAAFDLVRGLDPGAAGVMVDPGNNVSEGLEPWRYQVGLLGEYLDSFGAKDAAWGRGADGAWRADWVPVGEGCVDWRAVFAAFAAAGASPDAVMMPFYECSASAEQVATLKREVRRIRGQ